MARLYGVRIFRAIVEIAAVVIGSAAAGYVIGTAQHFVVFGVWDGGFGREQLRFACLEGGVLGAVFGVPTGLIVYYGILKRRLALAMALEIVVVSLIVGCTAGLAFYWLSCFFTPMVTIWFSHQLAYRQRKVQPPAPATI